MKTMNILKRRNYKIEEKNYNCVLCQLKEKTTTIEETSQKEFKEKYLRSIDPTQDYLWHWVSATGRSGGILFGIKVE